MSFLKYPNLISRNKRALEKFIKEAGGFSRSRKLSLVHTIGHILFLAATRNQNGYEITSQNYFAQYGSIESAVSRSSLSEARGKIDWKAFDYLLKDLREESHRDVAKWKGLNVKAIDGTFLTLPATKKILDEFPRRPKAKTHYPKGILVTAMNVFTGQPLNAVIESHQGSERSCLKRIIDQFEKRDVLLLDRGFEGIEYMAQMQRGGIFFVSRLRAEGAALGAYIRKFISSKKKTVIVSLKVKREGKEEVLKVRLIRGKRDRKGRPIILATNLLGRSTYKAPEILELYLYRWRIETLYYRSKELLKIETFHAKTVNGVLQEIWANLVILSLMAIMTSLAKRQVKGSLRHPSFKGALEVIRRNFFFFVSVSRRQKSLVQMLEEMLRQTASITCLKQPGRKNQRISKQSHSTWVGGEKNRLIDKYKARQKKKAMLA